MAEFLTPKNQNLVLTRYDYRITFGKTGRARYISHLDLMRAFQRAFKRAGIPIWYTQGFNPRAYLNFPLPLALGIDSMVEKLDVALIEELSFEELTDRLNSVMPEGICVVSSAKPVDKHTEIAFAEYEISFDCVNKSAEDIKKKFEEFINQDKIEIEKKTKRKGIKLVDIKEHINVKSIEAGDMLRLDLVLPAGCEFNLNTSAVIDAFCKYAEIEIDNIYTKRTKIMTKNGEDFN